MSKKQRYEQFIQYALDKHNVPEDERTRIAAILETYKNMVLSDE